MVSLFLVLSLFPLSLAYKLNTCAGQTSEQEREAVLEYHNDLRSTIAKGNYVEGGNLSMPTASNMLKLEWSCEVERSAQKVADRCEFKHEDDDDDYGENLFMVSGSGIDKENMITQASYVWQEEFVKYGWRGLTLTNELFMTGIGHATQMAWASTRYIGCASSVCKGGSAVHVVCQYEPRGNIIGQNIYDYGKKCSECPKYSSCDRKTGLCQYLPSNM